MFDPQSIDRVEVAKQHQQYSNPDTLKRRIKDLEDELKAVTNDKEAMKDNLNTTYFVIKCLTDYL